MTTEQKKRLLKAKIAVALQDELGRVPKQEEIEQVNLLSTGALQSHSGAALQEKGTEESRPARHLLRPLPMQIGYARVSTEDQHLDMQQDALEKAGCEKIFSDTISGTKDRRPGLEEALSHLRSGDTLVVWRLDRLGRSLRHLIDTVTDLQERDIGFKSLTESIDTTTSGGKLVFHIFGALAEFEREIIRERTQAGLTAARARGRKGGRRRKLTKNQAAMARELYKNRANTIDDICKTLGIGRTTFYRYIEASENG